MIVSCSSRSTACGVVDQVGVVAVPARRRRSPRAPSRSAAIASSLASRRERRDRLALEDEAELEGVADQAEVDLRHLHAALRHRADQPLGLEPRDQLADRAERHAGDRDQLALR